MASRLAVHERGHGGEPVGVHRLVLWSVTKIDRAILKAKATVDWLVADLEVDLLVLATVVETEATVHGLVEVMEVKRSVERVRHLALHHMTVTGVGA